VGLLKDNGRWEHCDSLNSCKAIHIHERFCLAHLAMKKRGKKRKDRETAEEITDAEKAAHEEQASKARKLQEQQQEQDEAEARMYPPRGITVRHLLRRDPDNREGRRDLIRKRCEYVEKHFNDKPIIFLYDPKLRSEKSRKFM